MNVGLLSMLFSFTIVSVTIINIQSVWIQPIYLQANLHFFQNLHWLFQDLDIRLEARIEKGCQWREGKATGNNM